MVEDNRFDGLDLDADPDTDGSETSTAGAEMIRDPAPEADVVTESAFGSGEAVQRPWYASEETWARFDDAVDFDIKRELRDRGVREVEKREVYDAVLQVAAASVGEVADVVERERENS